MQIVLSNEEVREILISFMESKYGDKFSYTEENCWFELLDDDGEQFDNLNDITFVLEAEGK